MDGISTTLGSLLQDTVKVEFEGCHRHTTKSGKRWYRSITVQVRIWSWVKVSKEILWGFHFYDLIDEESSLPGKLSICNLQKPLHIFVVKWDLVLREEVGKKSLHKVPQLGIIFAEGRSELDTSEGLYSLCGDVAQTRTSSASQLHMSK